MYYWEAGISRPLINVVVLEANHSSIIQIKGKPLKYGEQRRIAAQLYLIWFRNMVGHRTQNENVSKM